MKIFKFYPINKKYKSIIGAVPQGRPFVLSVFVLQELAEEVCLLLSRDGQEESQKLFMTQGKSEGKFQRFLIKLTLEKGLYWYCFSLKRGDAVVYIGKGGGQEAKLYYEKPQLFQVLCYKREYGQISWTKGAVMYHIFVDRFCKSGEIKLRENQVARQWGETPYYKPVEGEVRCNDFFGGNLKGIISKLDYLTSLGVSMLYLSPVFEAYSNHKYDTYDYEKIDEAFGDIEDFRLLCAECEKRGVRVILDGVFNHSGARGKYFNIAREYGQYIAFDEKSPYRDWFFIEGEKDYKSWWGIKTLPKHNAKSLSLQDYFAGEKGVVAYWLKEGASGFRLDVVDEIEEEFLEKIVKCAKGQKSGAFIIGEVWEDATNKISYGTRRKYFEGSQLDGVMNYPLKDAILDFLRNGNSLKLKDTMEDIINNYPKEALNNLMNIISTHDTPRAITALCGQVFEEGDKELYAEKTLTGEEYLSAKPLLKMAALLQYTLIGFPSLFYGDEAGLSGYSDPFCRRCYPWGKEDGELIDFYKKLGALRNNYKDAFCSKYSLYKHNKNLFSYVRGEGKEKILFIVSKEKQELKLKGNYIDFFTQIEYGGNILLQKNNLYALIKQ